MWSTRPQRPLLWALSLLVVVAACIPAAYLLVRASDAPAGAWRLLVTERTWSLLGSTLALALTVTALTALIALPLAWLTVRSNLPGRGVWTVALTLPLAIPSFIFGYVLLAAFGTGGLVETWGFPAPPIYGFWGAVTALTLASFPFPFLSVRAALLREGPSLTEAAATLGAPPLTAFFRVTLPRLVHALRSGGLLVAFYCLSDFGAVSLLQYDTFSRAIFMQLEGAFDRSLAALWSTALMLLAVAVLVLAEYRVGQAFAATSARASREWTGAVALGPWTLPALIACSIVAALGVALPLLVIIVWVERATGGSELTSLLGPMWNSVLASALAAGATLIAVVPLGVLGARVRTWPARALVRAAYAAYCLPPIVVALSLVSFGAHVVPVMYGSLAMLVFAHVVRFLPQALGPVQGAFYDLSPHMYEVGVSLGKPPWEVTRRVVLPLVRPGLMAGATLVFLTAMKELPATLLLAPIGFPTLATRIWSATAEGQFAVAALPALLLVALSSISVALTLRVEKSHESQAA